MVLSLVLSLYSLLCPLVRAQQCDPKTLEDARRAFRAENLSQAERLSQKLVDCPGQLGQDAVDFIRDIQLTRRNISLWEAAQLEVSRRRFERACEILLQIEASQPDFEGLVAAMEDVNCESRRLKLRNDLEKASELFSKGQLSEAIEAVDGILQAAPGLEDALDLRAKILEKQEEAEERSLQRDYGRAEKAMREQQWADAKRLLESIRRRRPDYRQTQSLLNVAKRRLAETEGLDNDRAKALEAMDNEDWAEAQQLLLSIRRRRPHYRDTESLLARIDDRLDRSSTEQEFQQLMSQAEQEFQKGASRTALEKLKAANRLVPEQDEAANLESLVVEQLQRERQLLEPAIRKFFSGEYLESSRLLQDFLNERRSLRSEAVAHFYLAAALSATYLLDGNQRDETLSNARKHYRKADSIDPAFTPAWEVISPRVRELLEPGNNSP